jgi:hypothetical protein
MVAVDKNRSSGDQEEKKEFFGAWPRARKIWS